MNRGAAIKVVIFSMKSITLLYDFTSFLDTVQDENLTIMLKDTSKILLDLIKGFDSVHLVLLFQSTFFSLLYIILNFSSYFTEIYEKNIKKKFRLFFLSFFYLFM